MAKFSKGVFVPKHPDKYMGVSTIFYKSSWELMVMRMCDLNPNILQWASESIKIPYKDPFTGRFTVYIPDFLVNFVDKAGFKHAELWEVKPAKQAILEKVGKNKTTQAMFVKNQAKWAAARIWCRGHGIEFRVITEDMIFHVGKK